MQALGREHMALDQTEERHDGEGPVANLSASVDNGKSIPSHLKRALWRLSGECMPNLSNRMVASNCGPMKPRGVAWNGAGGWVIFSQSRQVNFSRTVSISLKRRGISSSVSVTSSPSFDNRDPPQQAQVAELDDDALALDVGRPGLAHRPLAREGAHALGLRRCGSRGKLVLARRGDEVFGAPTPTARSAVPCARSAARTFARLELLDPQFKMRDQRLGVRQFRPRVGRISLPLAASACALAASACQLAAIASACWRASRSACNAARALARSEGRWSGFKVMKTVN